MLNHGISRSRNRSGQALIEFMFVAMILLATLFGMIDFCRAISTRQVLTNLSREGSNLASRGTDISNAVDAVILAASPLNITSSGLVIITAVTNSNSVFKITDQLAKGGLSSASSKIGTGIGTVVTTNMPNTPQAIPQLNQTVYVTEVYYEYKAATPIGKLLGFTLPTKLYDVAYF
jgi:Flp pilus assembly protein TadG